MNGHNDIMVCGERVLRMMRDALRHQIIRETERDPYERARLLFNHGLPRYGVYHGER
jgi:hypothetical protein